MPMFKKHRGRIPLQGRIRSEFQCLIKYGQNSNVRKDMVRLLIFTKIGAEFQFKEGYD